MLCSAFNVTSTSKHKFTGGTKELQPTLLHGLTTCTNLTCATSLRYCNVTFQNSYTVGNFLCYITKDNRK